MYSLKTNKVNFWLTGTLGFSQQYLGREGLEWKKKKCWDTVIHANFPKAAIIDYICGERKKKSRQSYC